MNTYKLATFTKWKESGGGHFPYRIRTIQADTLDAAIAAYKEKYPTENEVGVIE